MRRDDDDEDYGPPPKKSGVSVMLIVGIVIGVGALLGLAFVVCGGAWFFMPVQGPDKPAAPVRQEFKDTEPETKPAPAPDKAKAKRGEAKLDD